MRIDNKRVIILPLVLIGCMAATAAVALNEIPTEAEAEPVVKKHAEKIIKGPVSVSDLEPAEEGRNKKEESRTYEIAEAVIATIAPTPTVTPEPTIEPEEVTIVTEEPNDYAEPVYEEAVYEEPAAVVVDSCYEEPVETGNYYEDIPDETSEAWQYEEPQPVETGMQYLGVYYITHYSAEACGNAIGAAEVPGGLVEGTSIAVPEWWMLGHWFYIPNYGTFRADDISDGPFDIFHWYTADAVGAEYQDVYLAG